MTSETSQTFEPVKPTTQKLIAKQSELLSMLALSQNDLQRHDNHPTAFLEELLEEVKARWNQIDNNHAKICEDPHAQMSSYCLEERIVEARYKYSDITRAIYQLLESRTRPSSSIPQTVASTPSSNLPRMNLPTFSGSYLEWESFRDLFVSVVHNNSSLTDVQRLHYLRTCLKGEALARIAGVPLTGEEYAGAWTSLRERYENKRILVHNHVDHLVSLPALKRDHASDLRNLCDNATRVLRSLEILKRKEHLGNDICVYLIVQRLTPSLRKDWEKHLGDDTSPPQFSDLMKFLESSTRALESASFSLPKPAQALGTSSSRTRPQGPRAHLTTAASTRPCACCQGPHYIGRCPEFRNKTPEQRKQCAVQQKLCLNCLSSSHPTKGCKSEHRCSRCQRSHHSLLHSSSAEWPTQDDATFKDPPSVQDAVSSHHSEQQSNNFRATKVLLATAMVVLRSATGRCCRVRALLDQGSEASFISESAAQRLRLPRHRVDIPILGLGVSHAATARSFVEISLSAVSNSSTSIELRALVLPRLTNAQPPRTLSAAWSHLEGLELADPSYASDAKIELILGADVYGSLLLEGVHHGKPGTPTAQRTILGWILSGPVSSTQQPASTVSCLHATSHGSCTDLETSTLLRRFWEIEEVSQTRILTPEERTCEEHFAATHRRAADGRYVVWLPVKQTPLPDFRTTRNIAIQRLENLERRLDRSPQLAAEYSAFLQEYASLNHMKSTKSLQSGINAYYMPHHAVVRESSSTTKLRVVFNASQRSKDGISLNDCLFTGPALQTDLFGVILRWRTHRYVFTADIEKMYRQIRVHDDDVDFQRIVWRPHPTEPIRDYALTTVTYGTAAAPYLAIRTLRQLASDEEKTFPLGAAVLRNDFYVDDLLSGAENLDTALAAQREVIKLLASGGFRLRKWTTNDPALLQGICAEDRLQPASLALQPDDYVRTLGLQWNSSTDTFHFQVSSQDTATPPTKRRILSAIARLFDPLGWLAPVIAKAKILMQKLWAAQVSWDQQLPTELDDEWRLYQQELPKLSEIVIPRWTNQGSTKSIELHGFCDASLHAYAAAVYLRVEDNDANTHVTLLAAKSKVAPLKQLSIPRLELCGAVLLTRLMNAVSSHMSLEKVAAHAWTDSKIVLAWLQGHPTRWTCFVANRVSEIQTSKLNLSWHHVPSKDNPADYASRGMNAGELPSIRIWWQGPGWLQHPDSAWPTETPAPIINELPEARRTLNVHLAEPIVEDDLLFSPLIRLNPFLDERAILRVGGRLRNSPLPFEERHPAIIPKGARLASLLIAEAHLQTLHGGTQLTWSHLLRRYWLIGGRTAIRAHIHRFMVCFRSRAKGENQLMGDLPAARITPSRPFSRSGVDYAGPIQLRAITGRGHRSHKGYIALFICLATKAIHLEAVSDCSTAAFLAAFRRFVARRGLCSELWSDNGTNFKGADQELRALFQQTSSHRQEIASLLANDGTHWNFIPPSAPHFGGIWEAGVKSTKQHLKRIIGNSILTYEELSTVLAQIEACLNSRPISPLSNDPDDVTSLTPGHFLTGTALTSIPEPSLSDVKLSHLSRWQLIQQMVESFWKRWSTEYLHHLQQRSKWKTASPNLTPGTLVLLKEERLPPTKWLMGRIIDVHPGKDGLVRVVTIKTATTTLKRPVARLCPLPLDTDDNDSASTATRSAMAGGNR